MKTKVYRSVLHTNCGGEIVFVASSPKDAVVVCKKCNHEWMTPSQFIEIGDDMYIFNGKKE